MPETIRCVVCKKPVRPGADLVIMRTDAVVFGPDYASKVPPAHDQGWFEIGPDCLRRVQRAGPAGLPLTT